MNNIKHIPCGVCGGDKHQEKGIPFASEQAKDVTPGWKEISVVQCGLCGFYYADPMPFWSDDDLQVLYGGEYFGDESTWWHYQRTTVDPQRRLDSIEKGGVRGRLLDIGCGQGYFLEQALQRGWEVCGLEPSRTWAEHTSKRLNVQILAQSVERANIPPNSFDAVFSDSVIEHLPEPMSLMNLVAKVLKQGGMFYVVTPNTDALVNHVRELAFRLTGWKRSPYTEPLMSPYHVTGFTPRSMVLLAEKAGFEVRHLWVQDGGEEWRKEKKWTVSRFKAAMLTPILLPGELIGHGTTIEALLIKK